MAYVRVHSLAMRIASDSLTCKKTWISACDHGWKMWLMQKVSPVALQTHTTTTPQHVPTHKHIKTNNISTGKLNYQNEFSQRLNIQMKMQVTCEESL